jgi:hypothetical protein
LAIVLFGVFLFIIFYQNHRQESLENSKIVTGKLNSEAQSGQKFIHQLDSLKNQSWYQYISKFRSKSLPKGIGIDSITLNISYGVLNSIYFSVFQRIVVLFFSLFNIDKSINLKHNSIPSTGYL